MSHRTDADAYQSGAFLADQLQHLIPGVLRKPYAEIVYPRICPVSYEVDPGATSIKRTIWDRTGDFDLIGDAADDLPRSGTKVGEIVNGIRTFGGSFDYTQDELLAAKMAGVSLTTERADAVRDAYERRNNLTCLFGRGGTGLKGMLNHPAISRVAVTGNNTDAWFDDDDITPQQMLDLLNFGVTAMRANSRQVEQPNTLLMAESDHRIVSTTCRSTTDNTSVLELFLKQNPGITSVEPINELDPANSGGNLTAKRMLFYRKDPTKGKFHIPLKLTFLPPQPRNLKFIVPSMSKLGGFIPDFPLAFIYIEDGGNT
ncbi:MAG: DUF2184 domain-containing protein [Synechococcaceae cyanobacterium MAG-AL2]|uniref:major capsid family protein n=1 Tax=Candidatus Regnicoccus frigidus TaxID=3074015 RepID=UPI002835BE4E|nr:major capsid family protein [Candidatus Regnicoccus frigidus]MCT4368012.1 DUF2184 domain-containing protein [Candidatus Regnicoccus frigidus MAG-AL2]